LVGDLVGDRISSIRSATSLRNCGIMCEYVSMVS